MPRKRKKQANLENKIAQIGNYVSPKEGALPEEEVKEEIPSEVPPEEGPTEEKPEELTPEQLKEKIIKLISEVSSRGLSEEEKIKL